MGNLQMDKSNNRVFKDGKEIILTPKEFEILWLIASKPNKTFSSDDIIDAIMESGIMLHEKQFIEMMTKNICKKAGISFSLKNPNHHSRPRNKYFRDDY